MEAFSTITDSLAGETFAFSPSEFSGATSSLHPLAATCSPEFFVLDACSTPCFSPTPAGLLEPVEAPEFTPDVSRLDPLAGSLDLNFGY